MSRGAARYVLNCIKKEIALGNNAISYQYISEQTHYSEPTVQSAVKMLEYDNFIRVERGGSRKPNRYALVSEEKRRVLSVARLIGLIQ